MRVGDCTACEGSGWGRDKAGDFACHTILEPTEEATPSCPLTFTCPSIHTQANIIKVHLAVGSLSTMWGSGIELGLSGLIASAFTH